MKLINQRKQDTIRFRFEVAAAAILAPIFVSVTAFLTSPLAYGLFEQATV